MNRLPDFDAWAIFSGVARMRSFSAAATDLGLAPATVSKAVLRLEIHLGAALFNRSTRTLSLTPIGAELADKAASLLDAAEILDQTAKFGSDQPQGLVRISAPVSFGVLHVAPLLPELNDNHPHITIDLHLDDGPTDLVSSGFDIGVRIGWPRDSALRARKLSDLRSFLVAAPTYFARHGIPERPEDLARHRCLAYKNLTSSQRWRMESSSGEEKKVDASPIFMTNSGDAMLPLLHSGNAIAHMPEFMVRRDIADGRLAIVLPCWRMPTSGLYMVVPPSQPRPARVSAVLDHLASRLAERLHRHSVSD